VSHSKIKTVLLPLGTLYQLSKSSTWSSGNHVWQGVQNVFLFIFKLYKVCFVTHLMSACKSICCKCHFFKLTHQEKFLGTRLHGKALKFCFLT
jgi:hypothetical protein